MPRAARSRTESGKLNIVGPRVKERRTELRQTQEAFCGRVADVTRGRWVPVRQDIWKIEAQSRIVSDIELAALALALECTPHWLLGIDERPHVRSSGKNLNGNAEEHDD